MKIQFVLPNSNHGWAYPLLKWKAMFKTKGIHISVDNKPEFKSGRKADIIILSSRYYRAQYKTNGEYLNRLKTDLKADIDKLKDANTKIIFYDLSASSGSRALNIINMVDLFLKRQMLKDKKVYADKHAYRQWLSESNYSEGCGEEQLRKLHNGWNLAYKDYASWPIIDPAKFNVKIFKNPEYYKPEHWQRMLTASYRGKMKGQTVPQRKAVVESLQELSTSHPDSFTTGGIIKKRKFIEEMRNSKAAVSPFGYGEICYRDMEAFINGCILVKPSMEHVDTFPNLFIENETYVPVRWDLSDLKDTLIDINDNYNKYLPIAQKGQEVFKEAYDNFDYFYEHFVSLLSHLDR